MTADREQTRRDADWVSIPVSEFEALHARAEQAERERDELGPLFIRDACRLLGIDESDSLRMDKIAARLASVPALVEALREASTALSDASVMVETENDGWQVRVYQRLCDEWERADAALTVYEQSQGKP